MCILPEAYLRGAELFNGGKFYECHEVWEEIWLKAEGNEREFLHAMIQAAAALLHFQRGNPKGAQSVGSRAIERLDKLPAVMMWIDTRVFRLALQRHLSMMDAPLPRIEFL